MTQGQCARLAAVAIVCVLLTACEREIRPEDVFGTPPPGEAARRPPVQADITVPDDFSTIQSAIDAATPGNVILVKPGTYEESLTFKNGITLHGEEDDAPTVTCEAARGPVLTMSGCATGEVCGLTFAHTGADALAGAPDEASAADADAGGGEDEGTAAEPAPVVLIAGGAPAMKECVVRDGGGAGLVVEEGSNATVDNCAFSNNAGNGILYKGEGSSARLSFNVCKENGANGIYIDGAAGGSVKNNTCLANACTGLVVADKGATLTVKRNECTGNEMHGLWYPYGAPAIVKSNTFVDNAFISKREIGMLWAHGEYGDLEAMARRLRKDETRFKSGEWQLHWFYEYLAGGFGDVLHKNEEKYLAALAEWRKQFPKSVTQRVVLANAHVNWAWDARGGGWASSVTTEGWRGFRQHLAKAWDILVKAEKLDEKDPELCTIWVTVAMGQGKDDVGLAEVLLGALMRTGRPTPELRKISQRAMAAFPYYYPTYYSTVTALLPRWGGSADDVVSFAELAAKVTREREGNAMYARVAAKALGREGVHDYVNSYAFDWPRAKDGFETILAQYPESKFRLSGFCLMACAHRDQETAAGLFARIADDDWDSDIWRNEYRFSAYREWAVNGGPFPRSQVPLIKAVREGDFGRVKRLASKGSDVNVRNEYGASALKEAVGDENVELVTLLLEAGADANLPGVESYRPLDHAVRQDSVEVVRLLAEHGADVNNAQYRGWSPFLTAVYDGKEDMVAAMLEYAADLESRTPDGWTALHLSTDAEDSKCLDVLLGTEGCNADLATDAGETPLHLAAKRGNNEAIEMLLAKGANVNARDSKGRSPLAVAVNEEHTETADFLREHGGKE